MSNREVPVERDSVPIHLLVKEPLAATRAVAREVTTHADLWQLYGSWLATLFPALWEEVQRMARQSNKGPLIDLRPVIEKLGLATVIQQVGVDRVIQSIGPERMAQSIGLEGIEGLVQALPTEQRRELLERLQAEHPPQQPSTRPRGKKR